MELVKELYGDSNYNGKLYCHFSFFNVMSRKWWALQDICLSVVEILPLLVQTSTRVAAFAGEKCLHAQLLTVVILFAH